MAWSSVGGGLFLVVCGLSWATIIYFTTTEAYLRRSTEARFDLFKRFGDVRPDRGVTREELIEHDIEQGRQIGRGCLAPAGLVVALLGILIMVAAVFR